MPPWVRLTPGSDRFAATAALVDGHQLNTVCVEAHCPNRGECWSRGTATFMLLGDTCTRACAFCAVKTGQPPLYDLDEPARIAAAVAAMGLDYVVLTSVTRDELEDGGAAIFGETIRRLRQQRNDLGIELLTPDFRQAQAVAIATIVRAVGEGDLVWGHNIETVPRLYREIRKGSRYARSLVLLAAIAALPRIEAKSSLMLGLGEREEEVIAVLRDLRHAGVSRLALGQYLRPSKFHHPVVEYLTPQQFNRYAAIARDLGFLWVKAGPMVRSSYHAEESADGTPHTAV
jgi:lipoyl synthase